MKSNRKSLLPVALTVSGLLSITINYGYMH